ncbi:hypothetical protein Tco_0675396 [Tanacetum coccineum]
MSIPSLRPCMYASAALLECNYGVIGERRYGVSVPALTKDHKGIKLNTPYPEDQYAVLEIWNEYNILEDIKRGPYSKKSPIRHLSKATNPLQAKELLQIKEMADQDTPPPTITAMKIPIIKKGEYDIWSMRMRQYICHTYHNLWDIIVNGDLEDEATPSGEQSSPPVPKTAKQLAARRNQERIKSILLLAIPDEYLLKFHKCSDAKSLGGCNKI